MPDRRSNRPREATALEDSGTAQVLLFMGWMPPAMTALISGVVVAFRTGSLGALAVVVVGGTLVGYVACLTILFTVGHRLEQRGVSRRVANAFLVLVVAVGVIAALAVAVLVSSP
jgi:hypothetical protein